MQYVTTATGVPALPFERPTVMELAPLYRTLQANQPVTRVRTPVGDPAWLVSRHADVRAILADWRLGISHPEPQQASRLSAAAIMGNPIGTHETERMDHRRVRKVMNRSFSIMRMRALRPQVQAIVDGLLDDLAGRTPPTDFHEAFSFPVPAHVICALLGVPWEDRSDFRQWSDGAIDMADRARAGASMQKLMGYMTELIARKRSNRGEDVISDLIEAHEAGELREHELVKLAVGFLFAGHETTVARIDFGTLLLLTHPEQRARLQEDPSLAELAVEEVLRFATPSLGVIPRYANVDLEFRGCHIRRGDMVLLALEVANRDAGAFEAPDSFDIGREHNAHVTFGHGYRFCVGASLARMELQCVFGTLFRRFPTLRLAVPVEELRLRDNLVTGGLDALPVAWDAGPDVN